MFTYDAWEVLTPAFQLTTSVVYNWGGTGEDQERQMPLWIRLQLVFSDGWLRQLGIWADYLSVGGLPLSEQSLSAATTLKRDMLLIGLKKKKNKQKNPIPNTDVLSPI